MTRRRRSTPIALLLVWLLGRAIVGDPARVEAGEHRPEVARASHGHHANPAGAVRAGDPARSRRLAASAAPVVRPPAVVVWVPARAWVRVATAAPPAPGPHGTAAPVGARDPPAA